MRWYAGCLYVMLFVSCGMPSRHDIVRSDQLIGLWESQPFESQFGRSVDTFCLKRDGTVHTRTDTQAGPLENDGTYRVTGDRIKFAWPSGESAEGTFKIDSATMVLTPDSGKARRYERIRDSC